MYIHLGVQCNKLHLRYVGTRRNFFIDDLTSHRPGQKSVSFKSLEHSMTSIAPVEMWDKTATCGKFRTYTSKGIDGRTCDCSWMDRTCGRCTASGLHEEKMQVRPTISASADDGACDGACAV